jgi:hypothetical protein
VGPVEVRPAGARKGRGLFVTRDVAAGELLLVERATVIRLDDPAAPIFATCFATGVTTRDAAYAIVGDLVSLAGSSPEHNNALAVLCGGARDGALLVPPPMDAFRRGTFEPARQLSALDLQGACPCRCCSRLPAASAAAAAAAERFHRPPFCFRGAGIANLNSYHFYVCAEPSVALREQLVAHAQRQAECSRSHTSRADGSGERSGSGGGGGGGGSSSVSCSGDGEGGGTEQRLLGAAAPCPALTEVLPPPSAVAAAAAAGVARDDDGNDPNAFSSSGTTELHAAVTARRAAAALALLRAGADPYLEDAVQGWCPSQAVLDMIDAADGSGGGGAVDAAMIAAFAAAGYTPEVLRAALPQGTGLWLLASMLNHAAAPTAVPRFVGELMFVRAACALACGAEVTTSYGAPGTLGAWGDVEERDD